MVIVSAAVASLAAGNAFCLYRFLFARQYHAWKLETAADLQAFVLPSFRCPISQEVMREPVVTCDGQTYEKQNIQEWFRRGTQTSPLTNLPLDSKEVVPNLALRQAVADFNTKVCPVLREEFENRKRLENRVEVLLQREVQLQQEIAGQDGRRDEAMQALLDSLEEREAEVVALRKGKEEVLKDMERLRQTHQEELVQQQEEQNKAVELVEAEKQVVLAKSKAEADSLRRQRDNAVRIIQGLRRSSQPKASNLSGPRVTDLLEVDLGSQSETLEAEPPGSVGHGTRSSSVDSALPALPKDLAMAPGFSSLRPEVGEKLPSTSGSEGQTASSSALFGRFSQVRSVTSHGSARQRSSSATMQQRSEKSERPARSTMFRNLFRRPTNPAAGAT